MATLVQLQNYKADIDAAVVSAAADTAEAQALLAALLAITGWRRTESTRMNERLLRDRVGHLAYRQTQIGAFSRFLVAEIVRVQAGGTSAVRTPTTSADLSSRATIQPVRTGGILTV